VALVNPTVAARRVVRRADAVISIPYTSTALIGAAEGKPSIYYDPTGCLPEYSDLGHGVRVIGTKDHLREWVGELKGTEEAASLHETREDHARI
jgi:polysaccharide biosynthesis PFTS motif protein